MHRVWGYVVLVWGAFLMRIGLVRPPPESLEFFAYRRRWNERIARAFHLSFALRGTPASGATLVVANHSGFADINAIVVTMPPTAKPNFISKIEIGKFPIFGWHMRYYRDVLFDRKDKEARKRVVDESLARLHAGCSVVLFPEGTRSRTGVPSETVRPALIEAAIKAGLPIQPVAIRGTTGILEQPFTLMKARTLVRIAYGEMSSTYRSADEVWQAVLALWRDLEADPPTP